MSYLDIERTINELSVKVRTGRGASAARPAVCLRDKSAWWGNTWQARDGKLAIEDMAGGTFTISNGGVFGSLMGTPIINMPQSAILGMHATKDRAVVVNGQVRVSFPHAPDRADNDAPSPRYHTRT